MLGTICICYILFFMAGGCADRFVLFPSRDPIDARSAIRKTIPFQDGSLEAWIARSPGANGRQPQAYVVAFLGNAARAEFVAWDVSDWREKPVEAWTINYPGYGGSTGPARLSCMPDVALAAYDAVAKEAGNRPVYVTGTSLGSALALYVAANRPVAGLIVRTPSPLRDVIIGEHGWWNLWLLATPVAYGVPSQLDAMDNARKCSAPAVFLVADNDEVVPYRYQQRIADVYGGAKQTVVMKGYQHNDPLEGTAREQYQTSLDWLWDAVVGSADLAKHPPARAPQEPLR